MAWNPWTSLRRRDDVAASRPGWPWGPLDPDMGRRIIQGYYSATSYMDMLVGRLLDRITENTMVVLVSDHGWSLGQHGEWCKMSNYEEVVRVPMIVRPPPSSPFSPGSTVSHYVQLLDLFPSLVSLAGLPNLPSCPPDSSKARLQCNFNSNST